MTKFAKDILEAGLLERYSGNFAGGAEANNHLSLDKLTEHPELFKRIKTTMACLILAHNCRVDFLAPIPSGGDELAEGISEVWAKGDGPEVPIAYFEKTKNGLFIPRQQDDLDILKNSKNGVIIDDVSTTFSSLKRFLKTSELKNKRLSFCAIWRRGTEEVEKEVKSLNDEEIAKYWLVEKPLPNMIDKTSDLAKYLVK